MAAPYARYATNNGTASGCTVDEALLHGLLEVVERDATSFALIDWYASAPPSARRVDPGALPADLAGLTDEIGELFGAAPAVMDISTDLGVPVYCALPPRSLAPYPNNFGAGASLSAGLAARGYTPYWLRWDPDTELPVVCVLVPGLDTFFLARQGVPVLPTGRATRHLTGRR